MNKNLTNRSQEEINKTVKTNLRVIGIIFLLFIIFIFAMCFSSDSSGSSSSSSSSGKKCIYKYSDGSVCGIKTNKYDNFCDYHYENLYKLVG